MSIEDFEELRRFYMQKPKELLEIKQLLGNPHHDILLNIARNHKLFRLYKHSQCKKFVNILDGLDALTDDSILIFISELQLYGLFSPSIYLDFIRNINDICQEESMNSNTFQVILANGRQKLVFMCTDHAAESAATIDRIARFAKDYFGTSITTIENDDKVEFTVNKILDIDRVEEYEKFFSYIYKRDPTTAGKISILRVIRDREYKYSTPKLSKEIDSMDQLWSALKTLPCLIVNGGININMANGTIIHGDLIKDNLTTNTSRWIRNNPPVTNQSSSDYYNKYLKEVPNAIAIQKFTKEVKNLGYKKMHGKINYWTMESQEDCN